MLEFRFLLDLGNKHLPGKCPPVEPFFCKTLFKPGASQLLKRHTFAQEGTNPFLRRLLPLSPAVDVPHPSTARDDRELRSYVRVRLVVREIRDGDLLHSLRTIPVDGRRFGSGL